MKLLLGIACIAVVGVAANAQTADVGIFRFKENVSFTSGSTGHTTRLTVTTGHFDPKKHRVTRSKRGFANRGAGPTMKIDGRLPLGTGGDLPATEIRSMSVVFDGTEVVVPRKYYANFYNPNFNADHSGTKLSDDGTSLLVFMSGGTKDSLYNVIWVLKKNGEPVKFFNNCGDCEFKDFLKFLQKK